MTLKIVSEGKQLASVVLDVNVNKHTTKFKVAFSDESGSEYKFGKNHTL